MAWSFGQIGTPAYALDLSAGVTVPVVPGINANDILFLYVGQRPNAVTAAFNTPAGWTSLALEDSGSDTGKLFGKIAAGGETDVVVTNDNGFSGGGVMMRYLGGTLTVHAANQQNNSSQADIDTAAQTIGEANTLSLILGRYGWNNDPTITAFPNSATSRLASASALTSNELSLFVGEIIQTTAANLSAGVIDRTDASAAAGRSMIVTLTAATIAALMDSASNRGINRGVSRGRS